MILHANPLATIAARRLASVTTAGSGDASNSVAQVGTMRSVNPPFAPVVTYVNAFAKLEVPIGVVTATLTAPAVPAEVTAAMTVEEITVPLAATPPTVTLVAPVRFAPMIMIAVPPKVEPEVGETDEIVGGATYVNKFVAVALPFGVVTAIVCAPTVPGGVTDSIWVSDRTLNVAAVPPTLTLIAANKFDPLIVMAVPPRVVPDGGLNDEIVGIPSAVLATRKPIM